MESRIPKHIAIIMDGNGRWAQSRGLPRVAGHKRGAEAAKTVVRAASDFGVEYITLFGFSSENWKRPDQEVKELMRLLRYYLRAETAEMHKNNMRLRVIGDRGRFDKDIIELIENAENLTKGNDGLTVVIALNYGGRHDIEQAAQAYALECLAHGEVRDADFSDYLMTSDLPDPDLLIRTSGEQRISNFLLWQCAYAELIFSPVFWPDFGGKELEDAIHEYAGRERRFGDVRAGNA